MNIISSYSKDRVTLNVDSDKMQGVVYGAYWFGTNNGEPVFLEKWKPLPEPKDDDAILPFWSGGISYKFQDFGHDYHFSPHFDIQHLCGYNWTRERAEKIAAELEACGFFCMRSKRGKDGRYWEVWRLNGYWSAEGELREFVRTTIDNVENDKKKIKLMVEWLCHRFQFGTLDVSVQRAAMTLGD